MRRGKRIHRGFLLVAILLAPLAASPNAASAAPTRTEIDSVPGTILDVLPDRILFRERTPEADTLKVKDRLTEEITALASVSRIVNGFLTSHGAMFVAAFDTYPYSKVYEARDGALLDLGGANSDVSLKVKGDYAIWSNNFTLYRRDLTTGTTITVHTNAGNDRNDVAANGDVAFWAYPDYQIHRYRNGATEQLTHDSGTWQTYPLTDGVNVVYRKHSFCCGPESGLVAVYTAGGEVALDSFRNDWPEPTSDYAAAGGWVAFTRQGAGAEFQVWTRDASGVQHQVSPNGTSARIVALNPEGAVAYRDGASHLFIAQQGFQPVDFGPSSSFFVFWQAGQWLQAAGGSLFRLDANHVNAYPRPAGATPLRVSLVTAYEECTAPNRTHGPPLDSGSCNPPTRSSAHLTVGTADSNGQVVRYEGHVALRTILGNPATPADEADVGIDFFSKGALTNALTDYTGELRAEVPLRITDKDNTPNPAAATTQDFTFDVDATCAVVPDPSPHSVCQTTTTADALIPGTIKEGRRSIWQLGQVLVYDGGPDGDTATADNTVFAREGLFVP